MAENDINPQIVYWTAKGTARLLDLSTRRVAQLEKSGVLKSVLVQKKKCYNIVDAVHAYLAYLRTSLTGNETDAENASRKLKAEADIKELTRQKAELLLNELKGEMHRSEDVKEIFEDFAVNVKSEIAGFRNKAVVDLVGIGTRSAMAEALDTLINHTLLSLSKYQYDPKKIKSKAVKRELEDEEEKQSRRN